MGEWECGSCGYIHDGSTSPPTCPECGAPGSRFVFYPFLNDSEWDEELAYTDIIPYEDYGTPYPEDASP